MKQAHEIQTAVDPSFEFYTGCFKGLNSLHPQHQGLQQNEFKAASLDPQTIVTTVEDSGRRIELPQLMPVTVFEWLNNKFYEERFPGATEAGQLLYFTEVPSVVPGENVQEGIRDLARRGGVLAFDIPSADPQAKTRVLEMLASLNIGFEEPELLGTQTYFAGDIQLKREHELRSRPLAFSEAYDTLVKQGKFDPDIQTGTVLRQTVDVETAEYIFDFYEQAYQVINDHPCKQGLSPAEFKDMVVNDPDVADILALRDGVPESLYLTCNDLSKLSWVNEEYYNANYHEKMENGQVIWFPGIATNPSPEVAGHNSEAIIQFIADLTECGDNAFTVVFDFCDMNTAWLKDYIEVLINKTPQAAVEIKPIATQQYFAVKLVA